MTDSGAQAAKTFGRRSQGAEQARSNPPPSRNDRADVNTLDENWFVPTRLGPILFAGVAVVVGQLLIGRLLGLTGPMPEPGHPNGFSKADVVTFLQAWPSIAFLLFLLIYQGCHIAALYCLPAHLVLRWLNFKSFMAYAIGGVCGAFVFLSLAAAQGDRLTWATSSVELIGGALAGLFYRLFAGLRLRPPTAD
jgi:hypothetical protein